MAFKYYDPLFSSPDKTKVIKFRVIEIYRLSRTDLGQKTYSQKVEGVDPSVFEFIWKECSEPFVFLNDPNEIHYLIEMKSFFGWDKILNKEFDSKQSIYNYLAKKHLDSYSRPLDFIEYPTIRKYYTTYSRK